jgi:OFA family oxalate/formate antiporter-like MFS transporter
VQVSLGAVYIYSVFKTPLQQTFGWRDAQAAWPAQVLLACFALAAVLAGRAQDKFGPRRVATAGGLLLGAGMILASMSRSMGGLGWFIATFGVLGGVGIGTAYVCPVSACLRWFPDKRGLVTGLSVAGFGAGGLVFAPLADALIASGGVLFAIGVLGAVFLACVVAGAQMLSSPPEGYRPPGWSPALSSAGPADEFSPGRMLRTPQFALLWLSFFAGCSAGLMLLMSVSSIWQSLALKGLVGAVSGSALDAAKAAGAAAVSAVAVFNAAGRLAWGKISDAAPSRSDALAAMFALCAAALLLLHRFQTYPLFVAGAGLVAFCFGGFLSVYPTVTADFFGSRNVGANYGLLFTAYGAGGLLGPWLQSHLARKTATLAVLRPGAAAGVFDVLDYRAAFAAAGLMCAVAAVLKLATRPPRPRRRPERAPSFYHLLDDRWVGPTREARGDLLHVHWN